MLAEAAKAVEKTGQARGHSDLQYATVLYVLIYNDILYIYIFYT